MNNDLIVNHVNELHVFFRSGATKEIEFRLTALRALKSAIQKHSDALYSALFSDLHKSQSESLMTEMSVVLGELDLHIRKLNRWAKPERVSTPMLLLPAKSRIIREPLGVVMIIAPWNYPFQLMINPLIGAISAGNCALLKPSPYVPEVNKVLRAIISETFKPEYINIIEGGREVNTTLLEQKFDHIFFTGSPAFGKAVMAAAAKSLTPVTLELGGKSPCIVGREAKIDIAARRIVWGKLLNAGQTCIAPDYILVHSDRKEKLIAELKNEIKTAFGDDPQQSEFYPRIINKEAIERLTDAMNSTGKIVFGGQVDKSDRYIEPTIVVDPADDSKLMTEEIFGPIFPVKEYFDMEEVFEYINARPKPLALYYFGDKEEAKQVLLETSSGGACVNDTIVHIANHKLPFGGVGNSGMGRYHGKESFLLFSNPKSVVWSSAKVDMPFKYAPYKHIDKLKKFI